MKQLLNLQEVLKGKVGYYDMSYEQIINNMVINYKTECRKLSGLSPAYTGMREKWGQQGREVALYQDFVAEPEVLCHPLLLDGKMMLVPIEPVKQELWVRGKDGYVYIEMCVGMISMLYRNSKFNTNCTTMSMTKFQQMPEEFKKTVFPYWLIDRWQELFQIGAYYVNGNGIEKHKLYTLAGFTSQYDYAQSASSYIRPLIYFNFPEAIFVVSDGKDDILELEFSE